MLLSLLFPLFWEEATACSSLVFALGALLFAAMQLLMRYEGDDVTLRHLRRQQIAGAVFLVLTGLLLIGHTYRIGPLKADEWKLTLAIAAIFEVYTAFRIPYVLQRSEKKK